MNRRAFIVGAGAALASPFAIGKPVRSSLGADNGSKAAEGWTNPYVTEGLVAMWDGEWNAGGGNTAFVTPASSTPVWGDKYFKMHSGATGFISGENSAYSSLLTTPSCTLEMVVDSLVSGSNYAYVYVGGVATDWGICGLTRFITRDFIGSSSKIMGYGTVESRFDVKTLDLSHVQSYSCSRIDADGCRVITRAVGLKSDYTKTQSYGSINYTENKIGIGCGTRGGYTSGGEANVHSVRIYNRALTDSEVDSNYAIDRERFGL